MEETALPTCFGEWVKHRRKDLDLTQAELAGRMGYSTPALRKIEAGQRRPSKQLAETLAHSLEIPREDLPIFIRVARGELNIEQLRYPIRGQTASAAADSAVDYSAESLPAQLTPFIGREAELAALEKLLGNPYCRLLTLTGMGGVGKTRVAIELASRQKASFPGGIGYVTLASIGSPEFIVPAIAEVFGFSISGTRDPREKLIALLTAHCNQPLLLVLDNLEHLLEASSYADSKCDVVPLLSRLLQGLPNLKILITSLERVNIQGEWIFELSGLPFPTSTHSNQVEEYSAPALFLQHARQVKADFVVLPDEQPALEKICQLVEGNPLAIELAASWVGLFSVPEIAHELAADLDFLKTSMRDIPERHSSLRAALDHSWKLLNAEEQQVLRQLAVFRGGFQREAAEQVAGASLQILMSLHSKSLLLHREDGRYELNEIVRRYALLRLVDDPENGGVWERHCEYFLRKAQDQEKAFYGPSPSHAMQVLLSEIDNLRTAMEWGFEHHQAGQSLQIATALANFWDTQGYWREGLEWLERGLQNPEFIPDPLKARSLAVAGWLSHNLADFPRSIVLLRESEKLWRSIDDPDNLSIALCYLGASLMHQGDLASATACFEEAYRLSQQRGYVHGIYLSMSRLGHVASRQGDSQQAIKLFNDALLLAKEAGDEDRVARLLRALGDEYLILGDYSRAETFYGSAAGIYQKLGNRTSEPYITYNLGYIAIKQGNLVRASDVLMNSLRALNELGDKEVTFICLAHMALLADAQNLVSRSIRLLAAVESLLKAMGVSNKRLLQRVTEECIASIRNKVSGSAFDSAWAAGSQMTYDEVISYAVDRPK